ncbi:hypothetical protein LXA43DRAFT_198029 [Ganoderma leucocontextum]|nr:hypothetical protein LXA43DRAFT_198029 [Ganoderma leucocontextum]
MKHTIGRERSGGASTGGVHCRNEVCAEWTLNGGGVEGLPSSCRSAVYAHSQAARMPSPASDNLHSRPGRCRWTQGSFSIVPSVSARAHGHRGESRPTSFAKQDQFAMGRDIRFGSCGMCRCNFMSDMLFRRGSEQLQEGGKDGIWGTVDNTAGISSSLGQSPCLSIYLGYSPGTGGPLNMLLEHR